MKKTTNCVRGVISPLLANMVLDGMEDMLGRKFGSMKLDGHCYRTNKTPVHLVRYADDFIIIGRSKEILEKEVKPLITEFLKERGLELSEEKTKITHVSEGFDFLGQNIRRYRFGKTNSKLLTRPSKKNVKTFLDGIRATIKQMATAKQEDVIEILNPKIRMDSLSPVSRFQAHVRYSRKYHLAVLMELGEKKTSKQKQNLDI